MGVFRVDEQLLGESLLQHKQKKSTGPAKPGDLGDCTT